MERALCLCSRLEKDGNRVFCRKEVEYFVDDLVMRYGHATRDFRHASLADTSLHDVSDVSFHHRCDHLEMKQSRHAY